MKLHEILDAKEVRELIKPSDLRGFQALLCSWLMIAACFTLVAKYPSVLTVLIALVFLGGRHLALAILMHDASHYSLFATRSLNDWIGNWLCAYPTWQDLRRYRAHHMAHHKYSVSEKDPDLDLVEGYPTTRASLRRKLIRDILGISAIKRVYGLILMDLGYIRYTVSAKVVPIDQKGRPFSDVLKTGLNHLHGVIITNALLFGILFWTGHPMLYLLWIGSYLTTFSVFVRVRSIAEHACTSIDTHPLKSTRTTLANPLARLTVAPHRVNYHLEHHLAMTVPYFNLPKLHRRLKEKGALKNALIARNYFEVLKAASSR